MLAVAMGEPVEEIGPAPPMAANQIMISYWFVPSAVAAVKRSQDTSATMDDPVYPHFQTAGMLEMEET